MPHPYRAFRLLRTEEGLFSQRTHPPPPQLYNVWAKYRLPVTGRPDLAIVLQQKRSCRALQAAEAAAAGGAEQRK